ncbi:hypothetical protein SASPL_138758 [Salvia splendens]|uniref:Uncharacterized protein n=1 Tax=Salvia splendens TaxID=180675 RepID=A0A8X8WVS3_SALSN|nr:hypothetical protein SASPL_138758 [Salvia splendens]
MKEATCATVQTDRMQLDRPVKLAESTDSSMKEATCASCATGLEVVNIKTNVLIVFTGLFLKTETQWDKHFFPSWFLHAAADKIRNEAVVIFKEVDLKARTKSVLAPDESWDKILKVNSFAGAYFYKEEPIYASLACLFGMDDVKVEGEASVVVISNTTEELPADDITTTKLVDNEDEVNAPNVFPGPRVRTSAEKDRILPKPAPLSNHLVGPSNSKSPLGSSCGGDPVAMLDVVTSL